MAYEVLWTDRASTDVDRIVSYIAIELGSPKAAAKHLDAFISAADALAEDPEIRAISSIPALARRGLRTYLVKSYLLIYSFDGARSIIHRMFHAKQDYARLLGK